MKLKINGKYFDYFSELSVNYKLDSVASVFSFNVRFNHENPEHKNLFTPLSYKLIQIYNNNNFLLFTGLIINHSFVSSSNPNLLNVSGYSLPGILEDVTVPVSAYPLESINRSLKDVAARLLDLFNIKLVIDSSAASIANQVYKKSVAEPTDSIKAYLAKLTAQRNLVLSHTAAGEIVIYKPGSKQSVFSFTSENTLKMSLSVNGQAMHSEISVVRQPSEDNEGVETADTVTNPLIQLFRPTTKILSSGEDTDVKNAADNLLSAELKNINLSISLNEVLDILPGDLVEVINPEIFIYQKHLFMVTDLAVKAGADSITSELKLVLPETFTGAVPKNIFS